jgi:anti-sigma B factor antagonist
MDDGEPIVDIGEPGDERGTRARGSGGPGLSRSRHSNGAVIVAVTGRVEGQAVMAMNRYLHRCVDERPAVLVVDLAGVEVLDADALWVFDQVRQRGQREEIEVRLAGATPAVLRAVDAAAMTEAFRIYSAVAVAANLTITPRMPPTVLDPRVGKARRTG